MADLGEKLDEIEGLADKRIKLFGLRFTAVQLGALFTLISSLLGGLYAAFLAYQKIESIASLDIEAFEQRMELIEQKVTSVDENIYAVKNDLKTDIRRIEGIADDVERNMKENMRDVTTDLWGFRQDVKEVEDRLNEKLQRALDNPLAN